MFHFGEILVFVSFTFTSNMKLFTAILILAFIFSYIPTFSQAKILTLPFAESHFIQIGNESLHYQSWQHQGELKGRIALIHGFCGSTFCWRNNISALTAIGFEVIAIDVPPFGFSQKKRNANFSSSKNAERCWKLIEKLNPNDTIKWHLMGHSMGGEIIGIMANMQPEKVKGLIFVDGLVGNISNTSRFQRLVYGNFISKGIANFVGKVYFFKYKRIEKLLISAYAQEPDKEAITGYLNALKPKNTAAGILQMAASKDTFQVNLNVIPSNSIVIWGKEDKWIPLEKVEKSIEKLPFHPQLFVIEGAGHCPMETHSEDVNAILQTFLEK